MLIQAHEDEVIIAHNGSTVAVTVDAYTGKLCVQTNPDVLWNLTINECGGLLLELGVQLDAMPAICEPKPSQ